MATTGNTTFPPSNYSTPPSKDVEIIEDRTAHCAVCDGELVDANHRAGSFADWQHKSTGDYDHRAARKPRCYYCGGEGTTTHRTHSWHDSSDCARCGGSRGYAIGD